MRRTQEFICRNDMVLIRPADRQETTSSGIVLAGGHLDQPIGVVVDVGPGAWNSDGSHRIDPEIEIGDRIYYRDGAKMYEVTINNESLLVMREQDVLGVIITIESEN